MSTEGSNENTTSSSTTSSSNATKKRKSTSSTTTTTTGGQVKDDTRRLAQASRTLKACELCRKQKTRCSRSIETSNSCLRCIFLNKKCSFELNNENNLNNNGINIPFNLNNQENNKKLDNINDGINEILKLLKNNPARIRNRNERRKRRRGIRDEDVQLLLETSENTGNKSRILNDVGDDDDDDDDDDDGEEEEEEEEEEENIPQFESFRSITESSPFSIILNLFNDKTTSTNDVEYDNEEDEEIENIISLGILTELEVIELISNFRRNYGRWVSFPSNLTTEDLIKQIKKTSSLLLTSCCLVSIRYQIFENKQEKSLKYFMLIQQLIKDLNNSLIKYTSINNTQKKISGQVEFLQAITILSIYLISISKLESSSGSLIKLDPWILSNIGLSTFITKTSLGEFKEINEEKIVVNSNDGKEYDKVMIMRIYNHLCLAHIVNSIFSGRLCIIDSIRVEQTTTTLSLLKATNFDGRMVSEIGLLFITYNYLQSINKVEKFQKLDDLFHKIIDDIKKWFIQWEYLFNQPVLHFLEFNYNFCSMFVYYIYCHQRLKLLGQLDDRKSILLIDKDVLNHVFKSIDNEDILLTMFDYCLNVLYHINNIDNDSYFAYLSDQIHFIFFFCGIFMIKLTKVMIDKQVLINKDDKNKGIKVVKQLIHKFNKITNDHPDDILNNYKLNLESCISENM